VGRRLTPEERALRAISERDYQTQITTLATMYGWQWRHFRDSRKEVKRGGRSMWVGDADAAGWPDLVLVRPPEFLVIEVKRETGALTPEQAEWLDLLRSCGIEVIVARPSNFGEVQARLTRSRPR
jgi:hypothetical protein